MNCLVGFHSRTVSSPAPLPAPDVRASDADRERAVSLLREHAAQGRLTVEELERRIGEAYAGRTGADLHGVLSDLPRIPVPEDRRRDREVTRAEARRHVVRYVGVMLLLVAIWALTGGGYFWPVWPMLGWGIGVAAHAAPVLFAGQGRPAIARRPVA